MDVRAAQRELYAAGEYHGLSAVLAPAAAALVEAAAVRPGDRVLDVGAGDGNVALAAARLGAVVWACDLSPEQVARGRERTERENVDVRWEVADAGALPYEDGAVDAALSSFAAVMAPEPERVAAELCRVVRPGGVVALTAWPPDAYMGRLTAALQTAVPGLELPDPDLGWGDEATARARLAPHAESVTCRRETLRWDPARRAAAGADDCAGLYLRARAQPEDLPALAGARDAVEAAFRQSDGTLRADYLLVLARVR